MFTKLQKVNAKLLARFRRSRHRSGDHYCSVLHDFSKWAIMGKILGFFPFRSESLSCLTGQSESGVSFFRRYLTWSFLFSLIIFIFFSTSIIQPMKLYITVYLGDLELQSTDRFALHAFLASVHVTRSIAPLFPILMAPSILNIIRDMRAYDGKYKIHLPMYFLDWPIVILFVGSLIVLACNYIVSETDFIQVITTDDDPVFPLSYLLIKSKIIAGFFVEVGHMYAEFSVAFIIAIMRYISKFFEIRLHLLEQEILKLNSKPFCLAKFSHLADYRIFSTNFQIQPEQMERKQEVLKNPEKPDNVDNDNSDSSCFKIQSLSRILDAFDKVFRTYILGFFICTMVVSVVSTYMIIISLRFASIYGGFYFLKKNRIARGINALGTTGIHSLYRILLLINVGERIQNAGQSLLKTVSIIDTTAIPVKLATKIKQLRWMLHGWDFSVTPWNIFILNRRLILSICGSVVSFVIVLTQFRVTDPFQQDFDPWEKK